MNNFYHYFNFEYDRLSMLKRFKELPHHNEKGVYECVDSEALMSHQQPLFKELGTRQCASDAMLCSIDRQTGLHCNPGNNGLAILPIEGVLNFDFFDFEPPIVNERTSFMPKDTTALVKGTLHTSIRNVDSPILFNGRMIKNYWPTGIAIFYAVKIPLHYSWEMTVACL